MRANLHLFQKTKRMQLVLIVSLATAFPTFSITQVRHQAFGFSPSNSISKGAHLPVSRLKNPIVHANFRGSVVENLDHLKPLPQLYKNSRNSVITTAGIDISKTHGRFGKEHSKMQKVLKRSANWRLRLSKQPIHGKIFTISLISPQLNCVI